jgi:C1A family cysteine protease
MWGWFIKNGKTWYKCANSWGDMWGDKGFFYIDEEFRNSKCFDFYAIKPNEQ